MTERISILRSHLEPGRVCNIQNPEEMLSCMATSSGSLPLIVLSEEVRSALQLGNPVVALESTIISHGMPFPQNLRTAQEVEAVVRAHGATPATIAILQGIPHVGLKQSQLEYIAKCGQNVKKVSRRDLPYVIGKKLDGATTVSATMLIAEKAGIKVFVTGGIGGVHKNAESTMDISADLTELGRTPVAVICAGAKSVLDIPKTLEVLETQGVCVASYQSDEFPAFFSGSSGCRSPARFDSPAEVARAIAASLQLQLNSGMVIAVPIPKEHVELGNKIEEAIARAQQESVIRGIQGSKVTPFLLQRITELTAGKSLEANIELVKNNAKIGAQVACELSKIVISNTI